MIDFIGIGAQKSGTSWIYACLYEHPEICTPIKEIHFFSRDRFSKGKNWYEHQFRNCAAGLLRGEFSTSYLYSRTAPAAIKSLYPDAKLIAVLRNPVDRAYSQYHNAIKAGEIIPDLPFAQYVKDEPSVVEQGLYHEQLTRYRAAFPEDQMLVLLYEDIATDPVAFMRHIYDFLGVDPAFVAGMVNQRVNIARRPRAVSIDRAMHRVSEFLRARGLDRLVHAVRKTGVPDLVRGANTRESPESSADSFEKERLRALFQTDVAKLSTLLNKDMSRYWNI